MTTPELLPPDLDYLREWAAQYERASKNVDALPFEWMREDVAARADHLRRAIAAVEEGARLREPPPGCQEESSARSAAPDAASDVGVAAYAKNVRTDPRMHGGDSLIGSMNFPERLAVVAIDQGEGSQVLACANAPEDWQHTEHRDQPIALYEYRGTVKLETTVRAVEEGE